MVNAGMGPTSLSWADLIHWQEITGIELTPWEAKTLRRLSRAFVDQMNASKEPTCPAPFASAARNEEAVTEQFKQMFAVMKRNKEQAERKRP